MTTMMDLRPIEFGLKELAKSVRNASMDKLRIAKGSVAYELLQKGQAKDAKEAYTMSAELHGSNE